MNVSLTPELERWIEARVGSGLYRSSSELVREALRLFREQEEIKELRRAELRRLIRDGLDEADAGLTVPLTPELVEEIKREGRRLLADRSR